MKTAPQIGQEPIGKDLERIKTSPQYGTTSFVNATETTTGEFLEAMKKMPEMFKAKGKTPEKPIPVHFSPLLDKEKINQTYLTWYGHSAFLMEAKQQRILIDPMFGKVASPIPFGSKRFAYAQYIPIHNFKAIDVVLISHDHYDHLDYATIKQLHPEVKLFITALGVGAHLKKWGVQAHKIVELDWWEQYTTETFTFTATPARHFSGRGFKRDTSLWCGYTIQTDQTNIYFSADSGYGEHFKAIGEKLGPFDFAMMECGQYNETWSQIHMTPEESVQASIDAKAHKVMPIHWGAFRLAPHSWTDPITRFSTKANALQLPFITPQIGKRFSINTTEHTSWWNNL